MSVVWQAHGPLMHDTQQPSEAGTGARNWTDEESEAQRTSLARSGRKAKGCTKRRPNLHLTTREHLLLPPLNRLMVSMYSTMLQLRVRVLGLYRPKFEFLDPELHIFVSLGKLLGFSMP